MGRPQRHILQYLSEAQATEVGLVRVLQSQIAMTPRGSYRTALEQHLKETRDHAKRVEQRLRALGGSSNPIEAVGGAAMSVAQVVIAQSLALAKTPLDLVRGSGGDEKVLKNAKDACATEALEIATYTALERLARALGDSETADLAASIRADEERMLERVVDEIPKLVDAVAGEGSSYDASETGAAEATRATAKRAKGTARKATGTAKRQARTARKVPGVAEAEGAVKGAAASEEDLPIAGYGKRNADEIIDRLPRLSQVDLAKVEAYERKTDNRTTVLDRVASLRGDEPWAGYDDQTAVEVEAKMGDDGQRAKAVRDYERAHKDRAGLLRAAERQLSNA